MLGPFMVVVLCRRIAEMQVRAEEKLCQTFSDRRPRIISYRFNGSSGEQQHRR
jgi:hypothetical protein